MGVCEGMRSSEKLFLHCIIVLFFGAVLGPVRVVVVMLDQLRFEIQLTEPHKDKSTNINKLFDPFVNQQFLLLDKYVLALAVDSFSLICQKTQHCFCSQVKVQTKPFFSMHVDLQSNGYCRYRPCQVSTVKPTQHSSHKPPAPEEDLLDEDWFDGEQPHDHQTITDDAEYRI